MPLLFDLLLEFVVIAVGLVLILFFVPKIFPGKKQ